MGRLLGVDFGTRRIGLALSDPGQVIASAREVLACESPAHAANLVAEACRAAGAVRIVVGLPRNMDGSMGPAARAAEAFADLLRQRVSVPVAMWDERLSTKSAHDALAEAGKRSADRRKIVDKVAAQIILQSYLDAQPQPAEGDDGSAP
jgi:putative Holliday junction resolvase